MSINTFITKTQTYPTCNFRVEVCITTVPIIYFYYKKPFLNLMFMDPCTVIQISKKEPTRCNRVVEFIIPVFLNCSTCFGRHTAHHQELKNCNCNLWFYMRLWLPVAAMAKQLRNNGIINSATRLHLIGSFYEIYNKPFYI